MSIFNANTFKALWLHTVHKTFKISFAVIYNDSFSLIRHKMQRYYCALYTQYGDKLVSFITQHYVSNNFEWLLKLSSINRFVNAMVTAKKHARSKNLPAEDYTSS